MTWWTRLLRRKRMDEQLDKELRFHLEQQVQDLRERGYTAEEAGRMARLAFGGPQQITEQCRDARGTRWLEDLLQDIRYAMRTLRQKPGFAAVALLTLALGIGATTVMFTLINGVLLKPLPYAATDRLTVLQEKTDWSTQWGDLWGFAYPNYLDCKHDVQSMDLMALHSNGGTVTASGQAEYVDGFEVSANLFSLLGIHLVRGREFTAADDRAGAAPVAIISYSLWQRLYGGNSAAIGMPLTFEQKPYTVVGIAPADFRLQGGYQVEGGADVFLPIGQNTARYLQNREGFHGLEVWGRLHPGATLAETQGELAVIGRRLAAEYPKSNHGRTFIAAPLRPEVGDARTILWLLFGAVTLVLLIACVNVASLLLARAVSRERELAMRVALGASRWRVIRQCLTESAVLGLAGGAFGLFLAMSGLHPFVALWPGSLPRAEEVRLDWHVLLFALAVSLLSSFLFGLAPALRAPVRHLELALRAGAKTMASGSRRLHSVFVISEIGLAVVLLVAAGILGRTLLRLSSLDPGLNIHNVLASRVALAPSTLANPAKTRSAWQQALDNARAIPGVQAVAMVDTVPMREGNNQIPYYTSAAKPPENEHRLVLANSVTPDYLNVMRIPLLRGRFFTDQDRSGSENVVVIDDVMAQQAFPGEDPIGKHIWLDLGSDPARVVGVVGHVRYWGLAGDDQAKVRATLYYTFAQLPDKLVPRWSELMSIAVRTNVDPWTLVAPLRQAVRGTTGDQVLYEVRTLEQLAQSSLAQQRFLLLLFGLFAGIALLLASIGVYGVLAYLTSRRVPEIGVRMALGASTLDVLWLVLRQSLLMIAVGIAIGTAAALGAAGLLRRLVTGVQGTEPVAFVGMVCVLALAALLASFIPARRASRVDPMIALREE
ncbi:MAG TPA: ABC transporter permease [Candidatus Angelobacter sp.]|nr:ABC transporter permease [Candidatus Angelobacter sp.]